MLGKHLLLGTLLHGPRGAATVSAGRTDAGRGERGTGFVRWLHRQPMPSVVSETLFACNEMHHYTPRIVVLAGHSNVLPHLRRHSHPPASPTFLFIICFPFLFLRFRGPGSRARALCSRPRPPPAPCGVAKSTSRGCVAASLRPSLPLWSHRRHGATAAVRPRSILFAPNWFASRATEAGGADGRGGRAGWTGGADGRGGTRRGRGG